MFVVAAAPIADIAAEMDPAPSVPGEHHPIWLMGSKAPAPDDQFVRDMSCAHEMSEALYALDVLIPIVDLGEESRCEVRRFEAPLRPVVHPGSLDPLQIWASIPNLPLNDNRFW